MNQLSFITSVVVAFSNINISTEKKQKKKMKEEIVFTSILMKVFYQTLLFHNIVLF